jgi:excisionase family DNA binding protein
MRVGSVTGRGPALSLCPCTRSAVSARASRVGVGLGAGDLNLTVKETAERLGVSVATVRRKAVAAELPAVKVGGARGCTPGGACAELKGLRGGVMTVSATPTPRVAPFEKDRAKLGRFCCFRG